MIRTLEEFDLESVYADDYDPQFPSPLELLAVFCLMPLVGMAKLGRWAADHAGEGIICLAVAGELFGAVAVFLPYFLHGGAR